MKKKDFEEFKEEILDIMDNNQEKQTIMDKYEERLLDVIMKTDDPSRLEEIRAAQQIRRGILGDLKKSKNARLWSLKKRGKLSETEEDEEESPEQLPTMDIRGQTDAIKKYLGGLSGTKRTLVEMATKAVTGHSIDEILANPTLLSGMVERIQDAIPKKDNSKKGYVNSQGKEVDPFDPTGYSMAP